nr:hypothetical protein [Streptomyces sp. SID5468]
MAARLDEATGEALSTAQSVVAGRARAHLSRYSHQPDTPTPSPPGQPPALVTGRLRGSFDLAGPTSEGTGVWTSVMGPNTAYARIQELGGTAGHGAVLPARPYLRPTADEAMHDPHITGIFARAWSAALGL